MKVLVVGSGGREHCLVWKAAQSSLVDALYCAPGNAGTASLARNVAIAAEDVQGLLDFARSEKIDLTIIGPEAPLVAGIVDRFNAEGLKIFGPRQELAQLEGSKVFAKQMMRAFGVPTADSKIFDTAREALAYVRAKGVPLVVKADGLAAGKGVMVCKSVAEAEAALRTIMTERVFGSAGDRVIIEDFIDGEEVSILVFTDGETIIPLVPSQDHKRAYDNDQGPNTGGMGAFAPSSFFDQDKLAVAVEKVFKPLVHGLAREGKAYQGILYGGLMIKDDVPFVLEFNVRFGDPETQAIIPKLKSDLIDAMLKTVEGRLDEARLLWDERFCVCVVLASGGYPGNFEKGKLIKGLHRFGQDRDVFIFHAGTAFANGQFPDDAGKCPMVSNGGRVLNVAALGRTIEEAKRKAYQAIEKITFDKMFYRTDIAGKAIK